MNEMDQLLKDTAARLFGDLCDRAALERSEQGAWPADLWNAIEAAGLIDARDPEGDGRELLSLTTLAVIVRALGEFSVPLPVAETLLAQRQLARAGLEIPSGPLTVAGAGSHARLEQIEGRWCVSGPLRRVPWGRHARAIVFETVVAGAPAGATALVCLEGATPQRLGVNLANEPRDDFVFTNHPLPAASVQVAGGAAGQLARESMLMRTLQIAGGLGRILGMTVQYSMERVQFGRAIAKFQAVQHQVATMATHAAAAAAAAEAAVHSAQRGNADFEVRAAKLRASEAAGVCCRVAHQVHGAMGFTHEHGLHTVTRRLMSWRDEFGSEAQSAEWIGERIQRVGGADLWCYVSTPDLYAGVSRAGEARDA